ncbi:hypothetical protein RFI_28168 [Reticulomyxa filosa]|uniref:Uncharacterized protein n=1 Tax=Reticulomyxa filosa TaxID=46433 RepID=X6M5F7_RETFI|nr:hypothetical protein RFI_28168 [Reticulomyxa filosa]|eukprot:ETO09218.1 hypothetical protein RFI_28168 [Reticulomyxa filosa]
MKFFVSTNFKKQENSFGCVAHKDEILICGRAWYSYHTVKQKYKLVCYYPQYITTTESVVKIINNNDSNDVTLLSFGQGNGGKHILIMKYVSVWDEEKYISQDNNQWIEFTDKQNKPVILEKLDSYSKPRALIGGSNNNLLFITYEPNNISVLDLNTCEYVNHSKLPINGNSCFVLRTANKINEMVLFCKKAGLSIKYDEDKNKLTCKDLPVCDDVAGFSGYAYVHVNNCILFFGGLLNYSEYSNSVYKYSIKEKKWTTFKPTLPFKTAASAAILSEDNKWVHVMCGEAHIKTRVEEWMNKKEKEELQMKEDDNVVNMNCNLLYYLAKQNENKID